MKATAFEAWFATEVAALYAAPAVERPGMVMGCPVWGERYVERLTRYCLPSMMAPANLAALRSLGARLVLFTDDPFTLWRRMAAVERAGIALEIRRIPAEVIAESKSVGKYHVLGAAHGICLQMAARAGQAFHMLVPDQLYGDRYFEGLARLARDHEAIAHTEISVDIDRAAADIEAHRRPDGSLAIADVELGDLGLRHIHQQTAAAFADLPDFAYINWMVWRGEDALHVIGPHLNAAWLSPALVRAAPVLVPSAVDSELPMLMPNGWHMPGRDDGLMCVELSDANKAPPVRCGFEDFLHCWWRQMNFQDGYLEFASRRTLVPVSRQVDGLPVSQIGEMHASIIAALKDFKPKAMETYLTMLLNGTRRLQRRPSLPAGR